MPQVTQNFVLLARNLVANMSRKFAFYFFSRLAEAAHDQKPSNLALFIRTPEDPKDEPCAWPAKSGYFTSRYTGTINFIIKIACVSQVRHPTKKLPL